MCAVSAGAIVTVEVDLMELQLVDHRIDDGPRDTLVRAPRGTFAYVVHTDGGGRTTVIAAHEGVADRVGVGAHRRPMQLCVAWLAWRNVSRLRCEGIHICASKMARNTLTTAAAKACVLEGLTGKQSIHEQRSLTA